MILLPTHSFSVDEIAKVWNPERVHFRIYLPSRFTMTASPPSPEPDLPVLELPRLPTATDSTEYLDAIEQSGAIETLIQALPHVLSKKSKYSIDCSVRIRQKGTTVPELRGRIMACRCFQGAKWSVTIRLEEPPPPSAQPAASPRPDVPSNFAPPPDDSPGGASGSAYYCSLETTRDILYEQVFADRRRTGMIVITGATASGKSEITRRLIHRRMQEAAAEPGRRPHLITFEDPIEKFYVAGATRRFDQPASFDYTPRERWTDAPNLRSVFRDALRQTPTLVFVGEIRDKNEWNDVVEFAGTGHSIIATAHAGSLAETWGKILTAVGAMTPSQRSDVADRVLGIVHLKPFPDSRIKGSFPALWRYTPSAAKSLMADGRGSLVPLRDAVMEHGSLGRVWFIETVGTQGNQTRMDQLKRSAFASDLEGI